ENWLPAPALPCFPREKRTARSRLVSVLPAGTGGRAWSFRFPDGPRSDKYDSGENRRPECSRALRFRSVPARSAVRQTYFFLQSRCVKIAGPRFTGLTEFFFDL